MAVIFTAFFHLKYKVLTSTNRVSPSGNAYSEYCNKSTHFENLGENPPILKNSHPPVVKKLHPCENVD
jgi:hypothetical protein